MANHAKYFYMTTDLGVSVISSNLIMYSQLFVIVEFSQKMDFYPYCTIFPPMYHILRWLVGHNMVKYKNEINKRVTRTQHRGPKWRTNRWRTWWKWWLSPWTWTGVWPHWNRGFDRGQRFNGFFVNVSLNNDKKSILNRGFNFAIHPLSLDITQILVDFKRLIVKKKSK